MADVYTTNDSPRDTVVVERDGDVHDRRGLSTGTIVALVIATLILMFLLFGGGFGGGGTTNVNTPTNAGGQ